MKTRNLVRFKCSEKTLEQLTDIQDQCHFKDLGETVAAMVYAGIFQTYGQWFWNDQFEKHFGKDKRWRVHKKSTASRR